MHIILKLVDGGTIEQTINTNNCVIGRSAKCDIVVPSEGVSRQHCQIELINGEFFVTDLGSTNGVLIDGQKITPHKQTPYQTFLSLSFGAVQSATIEDDSAKTNAHIAVAPGFHNTNADQDSISHSKPVKSRTMKELLREQKSKGAAAVKAPEGKLKEPKPIALNILAILILLGAVFWYMTKEEGPVEESLKPMSDKRAPKPTQKQFDAF